MLACERQRDRRRARERSRSGRRRRRADRAPASPPARHTHPSASARSVSMVIEQDVLVGDRLEIRLRRRRGCTPATKTHEQTRNRKEREERRARHSSSASLRAISAVSSSPRHFCASATVSSSACCVPIQASVVSNDLGQRVRVAAAAAAADRDRRDAQAHRHVRVGRSFAEVRREAEHRRRRQAVCARSPSSPASSRPADRRPAP